MNAARTISVATRRRRKITSKNKKGLSINVPLFDFTNVEMEDSDRVKPINEDYGDSQPETSDHNVIVKSQNERTIGAKPKRTARLNMIFAVYEGDEEGVRRTYVTKKAALEGDLRGLENLQHELNSAFLQALMRKRCDLAKLLLDLGASTDGFQQWYPAVSYVVNSGCEDILDLLIERGISFSHSDYKESTVLHTAARIGNSSILMKLLALKQVDVDEVADTKRRVTPLHIAVEYGHYNCSSLLIEAGADVNAKDHQGKSPSHLSAIRGNNAILTKLIWKGANLDLLDNDSYSSWFYALQFGHKSTMELIEQHIDAEAIKNTRFPDAKTFLHAAVKFGNMSAISYLIEKGCSLTDVDNNGETVLMCAVNDNGSKFSHVVKHLLNYKVCAETINFEDKSGTTALGILMKTEHFANTHEHIGKYLIKAGARIESMYCNWYSMLLLNILDDRKRKFLIANGADLNFRSESGSCVLWEFAHNGYTDLLEELLDKNIDVGLSYHRNSADNTSPLMAALDGHHCEVAELLLCSDCCLSGFREWLETSAARSILIEAGPLTELVSIIQNSGLANSPHSLWKQARMATLRTLGTGCVDAKVDSLGLPTLLAKLMKPSSYRRYNKSILNM